MELEQRSRESAGEMSGLPNFEPRQSWMQYSLNARKGYILDVGVDDNKGAYGTEEVNDAEMRK